MRAATIYAELALAQAPRLLSVLDREPFSASFGSFDREHWAWKFRDFPLGMMQTAVFPLALLWRHRFEGSAYQGNAQVRDWIVGALGHTLERQYPNGAFDVFAPFEQDPGPTLGVMHGLSEAFRLVREDVPAPLAQRFLAGLRRACDFALSREEQEVHAFISNHWALFAVTYLSAHELLGDVRYRQRADRVIERILREQSPDGWYNEYGGPDPGYESLGIHHLAVYWQRTGDDRVLESLRRSVEFYAHCVHPDGSVGGVYGSRHTSLYFPGGFEILADEVPTARAIAAFLRDKLLVGNVVTPATADAENLIPMLYSYLQATVHQQEKAPEKNGEDMVAALPCRALDGIRRFTHSGITVAGTKAYYAVVHTHRGGVCRVFDRRNDRIAYEDAGYLIRAQGRWWSSQLTGMSEPANSASSANTIGTDTAVCTARFARVEALLPTPAKFLLLRMLNLTLFRSRTLGTWLRNRIVARLIMTRHPGAFRLRREVRFETDEVRFLDRLDADAPADVQDLALPRSFTGIHMGSAKYFHAAELEATQPTPVDGVLKDLKSNGHVEVRFTVSFAAPQVTKTVRPPT